MIIRIHAKSPNILLGGNNSGAEKIDDLITLAKEKLPEIKSDEMSGWLTLPADYDREEYENIKSSAKKINQDSKYLVCIGIGGSYLGHRAIIEALGNKSNTKVLYTGNSLSTIELEKVLAEIGDDDFSVNVISKSGTTTEPAIAFRIFKHKLIEKYGEKAAAKRIYATTDAKKGALHDEAVANGYTRFIVPDNVGGRYSVFTAVGLLPLAVAGIDLDELLGGARKEMSEILGSTSSEDTDPKTDPAENTEPSLENHPVFTYAAYRNYLYENGFDTENLGSFEPSLHYFIEWWKQLFGESEGKGKKGIFPTGTVYTTDLHSLGQFIQDGRKNLFETMITFAPVEDETAPETPKTTNAANTAEAADTKIALRTPVGPKITVPSATDNLDQLDYLLGRDLRFINKQAELATLAAHSEVRPVFELELNDLSEKSLGALIYFFELACALSAKLLGVNPFDQPGVDNYKNKMFALLGKPTA